MRRFLARYRVALGFVCAGIALAFAQPSPTSLLVGGAIALAGELVRVWAAGHIEKSREVTRSGPYQFVRHPLYVGSAVMGIGFMVAASYWPVTVIVSLYLVATLGAAIRTEEATLETKFAGEYSAYRAGRSAPVVRSFSLARVAANREYRAIVGLIVGFVLLYARSRL